MNEKLIPRLLEVAIQLQQIPAPTFAEAQRGALVRDLFRAEGLTDIHRDRLGNVYGRLPGRNSKPSLVVSAHLDTVFPANTDLTLRREPDRISGPGIGDNAIGLAGLFGLLWTLREKETPLAGDLWLVANVGEEGLGDLRGMKAVVERFGDTVGAYIALEGMALGQIYHRGLGVERYRISVHTQGGHSWVDFGRPSAVHELARLITRLTDLPIPSRPRASLNVGIISGGTSVNSIAADAYLDLDLRSESPSVLRELVEQVRKVVRAANRLGEEPSGSFAQVQAEMALIGQRPAGEIPADHPLVRLAAACLEAQGLPPRLNIGSTDANVPLSRGLPAICLGITTGGGAHTLHEYILTEPIGRGLAQLVGVVEGFFSTES